VDLTTCYTLQHTAMWVQAGGASKQSGSPRAQEWRLRSDPKGYVLPCLALCFSVLHCVLVCCSVLQCVAVCFSVLHHSAPHCNSLQHTASKSGASVAIPRDASNSQLQCVAGCCRVLKGVAGCCRVLLGVAGCCRVLQ